MMTVLANFWAALQPLLPIIGVCVLIVMAAWTIVTVRAYDRRMEARRVERDRVAFVDWLGTPPPGLDETPIYAATVADIARVEAEWIDAEWELLNGGAS